MKKEDVIRKISSRKFWACVTAVVVSLIAFTNASPETTERVVALLGAIGGLCIYMLSEGIADSKKTDITNIIETEKLKDNKDNY